MTKEEIINLIKEQEKLFYAHSEKQKDNNLKLAYEYEIMAETLSRLLADIRIAEFINKGSKHNESY